MHAQTFEGKIVSNPTHSSPPGQIPLHTGAVSPQGDVDETQAQTSRTVPVGLHTASGGQVPSHAGAEVLPHGGRVVVVVVGAIDAGAQRIRLPECRLTRSRPDPPSWSAALSVMFSSRVHRTA
jgi:hypothetical protein